LSDLREDILNEIRRLAAAANGQPPGQNVFSNETGIASHKWRGVFWAKWSDALIDAGFEPNNWQSKGDTAQLLVRFAELTLTTGRIPTNSEIDLARRTDGSIPSSKYVLSHFGGKAGLASALIKLSTEEQKFAALREIIAEPVVEHQADQKAERLIDGWVYLLKSGDNYKIGRSDNLERRVKQISVAMPEVTNLFHAIQTDDPVGIEEYWHKRFANRRLNGEWFKLTKSDIAAFKRRKFQ
jgi:Meiotically up-regulated gene 113